MCKIKFLFGLLHSNALETSMCIGDGLTYGRHESCVHAILSTLNIHKTFIFVVVLMLMLLLLLLLRIGIFHLIFFHSRIHPYNYK